LSAVHVIHTVGPVWSAQQDRSHLLGSAYRESLRIGEELGAHSIAFPAISAGVYGWPIPDAARIAVATVREHIGGASGLSVVRFVLFNDVALAAFRAALTR
jgi:O-acetyl-ADP-ribose deacetylase (regulator of RNase III)